MKQNNYLEKEISKIKGNLLGIGISNPKILKKIKENNNITICNLLDNTNNENGTQKGKGKKFNLNKLRKNFKKKRVNYLIVKETIIKEKTKNFISDSIYITKDYILYLTDQKEKIIKQYSRYQVGIEEIKCSDGYIIKINAKNAKNNKGKEIFYKIYDIIEYSLDFITDFLLN